MKIYTLGLFLFAFTITAGAQSRSLDFYLEQATANSPAIREQQNLASAAELQKDIVEADLNRPYISATGDYMYAPYSNNWGYDPAITDGGHYDALLNANYPLFTGKSKSVRRRSSSISIRQSKYQIMQIKHQLRQSITDQYITTYQGLMKLQYRREILDLLNRQKDILHLLAKQGITPIVDLKQFNIRLKANRIAQQKAENTYTNDLLKLNTMCGISDSTTSVKLQKPSISITPLKSRHSRFMNKYKLDSLNIANQQQLSELKYQPNVSLFGDAGLNAVKFTGIQNRIGYSAGLHFSIPIYDGHQRSITRQQSRLQQHSVDAFQRRFKNRRTLQLASLRKQLRQTEEQLDLIQQQITNYKDLLDNYRKKLASGISSVVNYLIVLRNYADARQQQVQTIGEQLKLKNEYNYWNW